MNRLGIHFALVSWMILALALPAVAAGPTPENLTGKWSWTSYLLNPASRTPGQPPQDNPLINPLGISVATIWAEADLELTETPAEGDKDSISGTLTFKPIPFKLNVTGRRVKRDDGVIEFAFSGKGQRPVPQGGSPVAMSYEIRGVFSSAFPKDGPGLSLRGYIRNIEGDPYFPTAVGAFVLIPAKNQSTPGQ
jgi:hypothetical protein